MRTYPFLPRHIFSSLLLSQTSYSFTSFSNISFHILHFHLHLHLLPLASLIPSSLNSFFVLFLPTPIMDRASRRTLVLSNHLLPASSSPPTAALHPNACLHYSPPELSESFAFDITEMRKLMDAHNLEDRDWAFGLIRQSGLFNPRKLGDRVFVSPDYNQTMEQQREMTMKRIEYLLDRGVYQGWLTRTGPESELRKLALFEVLGMFDHSIAIKLGVHFFLWYVLLLLRLKSHFNFGQSLNGSIPF